MDIGTSTGKFAILIAQSDPTIEITMIDLPDQLEAAKQHVELAGVSDRINKQIIIVMFTAMALSAGSR